MAKLEEMKVGEVYKGRMGVERKILFADSKSCYTEILEDDTTRGSWDRWDVEGWTLVKPEREGGGVSKRDWISSQRLAEAERAVEKSEAKKISDALFWDISDRRGLKNYFFFEIDKLVREDIAATWDHIAEVMFEKRLQAEKEKVKTLVSLLSDGTHFAQCYAENADDEEDERWARDWIEKLKEMER